MIFVDLCCLIFLPIWKILTASSISICSIEFDKAINIPVRPTPALVYNKFKSTHTCLQWHLLRGKVVYLYKKGEPSRVFSVNLNKFVRLPFYRIPTAIVSVSYNYVKNHNFRKKVLYWYTKQHSKYWENSMKHYLYFKIFTLKIIWHSLCFNVPCTIICTKETF